MLSTRILARRSFVASRFLAGSVQRHSIASSRFLSAVAVPEPPTSHHIHRALVGAKGSIIYTETDEAPALATYSLLPVIAKVREFAGLDWAVAIEVLISPVL
jgi:Monomeric isocitrate dehydrogenase